MADREPKTQFRFNLTDDAIERIKDASEQVGKQPFRDCRANNSIHLQT